MDLDSAFGYEVVVEWYDKYYQFHSRPFTSMIRAQKYARSLADSTNCNTFVQVKLTIDY